jgi:hypothetical protein
MFLAQHDDRISDHEFRMYEAFLIWPKKAHPLLCPEGAFVKPDRLLNIPYGERGCDGMKAGRNWFY